MIFFALPFSDISTVTGIPESINFYYFVKEKLKNNTP